MSSKQVPDHDGGVVGKAISPQIQDALVNFCMEYVFFTGSRSFKCQSRVFLIISLRDQIESSR